MNKLKTILLVDDDEATNFINKRLIHKSELTDELVTAHNGREAIDFLQRRLQDAVNNPNAVPELILLDINMPVMDGFDFLQAYENLNLPNKESVVIAVLTTSLNPKDLEKVRASGITDFLNKPLTKASLQNLIEKHFN